LALALIKIIGDLSRNKRASVPWRLELVLMILWIGWCIIIIYLLEAITSITGVASESKSFWTLHVLAHLSKLLFSI
jgi:hypothetical protein